MKNTLEILDNYLERAVAENLNIVDVLDHIFSEEAKSKRRRAYEKQIQMSGFPIKKTLDDFDFSFQPSIDKRQIDVFCSTYWSVFYRQTGPGRSSLESYLYVVLCTIGITLGSPFFGSYPPCTQIELMFIGFPP